MKRTYQNDYPSVTQVLSVLRKPALENWYKYNATYTIKKVSEQALEIGDQIHKLIQDHIERDTMKVATKHPEEVRNAVKSFMLFKKEHPEFKLKRSEIALTSEMLRFNGTIDCVADIDGRLVIVDWKTGKAKDNDKPPIYDEHKYQTSAYMGLWNEHNGSNNIVRESFIVSIAKDKIAYNFEKLNFDYFHLCFDNVFIPCLKIWYFMHRKEQNDV